MAVVAAAVGVVATVSPVGTAPAGAAEPAVVITEIHYHPAVDGREFLELHNPGDEPIGIGGACLTAGIGGCFAAGTAIPAGGFAVVVESPADYAAAFPGAPAPVLTYTGSLSNGGERVTVTDGDTVLDTVEYSDSSPWPSSPDGNGPSLELRDPLTDDNDTAAAWEASDPAPTPGAANNSWGRGPAPVIGDVAVGPTAAGAPTAVTATVSGAETVELELVIGFGTARVIAMADDGAHGDGAAGDGVYGATVAAQPANTLVRYRVLAYSGDARSTVPDAGDARPRLGFVVAPTTPPTALPLLQWFIDPDDLRTLMENITTNDYVPAVVAYGGQVWDGAEVRGQGNTRDEPKVSFKFKMPDGQPLVASGLVTDPVDEFVIDDDRVDAMGTTTLIGLDAYGERNPFIPQRAKVRVHRNGSFFGLFTFLEEWEDAFFSRVGLDRPGAAVYEPEGVDGVFVDEGSPDALRPRFEELAGDDDYEGLYELVQVIDSPPTPERTARLRDLFDGPALVEFLAMGAVLQHWDQTVHNFFLIRDPDTGRWRFGPVDLDNSLGLPPHGTPPTSLRMSRVFPFGPDSLVSALRTDPVFSEMYFRRLRTLADDLLAGGRLEARADALAPWIATDVEQDRVRYGRVHTAAQGRAAFSDYLDFREGLLLDVHRGAFEVPGPPSSGLNVVVSEIAYAATGGPGHDLVELHNPSTEAIDLSGWTIEGAATGELPPGTVLPAGAFLVVPGDQEASAASRPSGTLVAGKLAAGVADGGGALVIRDATGSVRGGATYGTTAPWPTAPTTGAATLELVDPTSPGTGPSSWRASATPTGSPGGSGNPAGPPPALRLSVSAAADQVEVSPGDGRGVGFSVVVANTGTTSVAGISLAATGGARCPAVVGSLAPGASARLRCRSTGSATRDRTFTFTAWSGSLVGRSNPVQVRTLDHATQYLERHLPGAPTSPEATVRAGGRIDLRWTRPAPSTVAPPRWIVITECAPGLAAPTGGTLRAPGSTARLDHLPLDRPVQLAVAVRNRSGTGPTTVPTPELTPRSSVSFPFADVPTLVERLVVDADGRQPGPVEIGLWEMVIEDGVSPSQLVVDILAKPRWTVDVAPVVRLYAAYFGRLPDQAGLDFWVAEYGRGVGLSAISTAFAHTPEFRARYGPLTDLQFVTQLYRNVFEREPDLAGRRYWVDRLSTGLTRGRVVTAFSESFEGQVRLAPMVQTSLVWTAMTGTTPTMADARPAVDWLAGGGSLLTVVEGVRTSDRYADHVG